MTLTFYYFENDPRRVNKSDYLQELGTVSGVTLKDDTEIFRPTFILKKSGIPYNANYCYCPNTNRYYFIDSKTSMLGRRIGVSMTVDVLYSFCTDIIESPAYIDRATTDMSTNQAMLEQGFPFRTDATTESIDFPNAVFSEEAENNVLLIMSP